MLRPPLKSLERCRPFSCQELLPAKRNIAVDKDDSPAWSALHHFITDQNKWFKLNNIDYDTSFCICPQFFCLLPWLQIVATGGKGSVCRTIGFAPRVRRTSRGKILAKDQTEGEN
jgi:hypothetical protein